MDDFPQDMFKFAFIPNLAESLASLKSLAEPEDWEYHNTQNEHPLPVLYNYLKYTYKRLSEEGKISLSKDGQFACWNTGLVTLGQEPIFAFFEVNRSSNGAPWFFKGFVRKGHWELTKFDTLPDIAHYFSDPSVLVLDGRSEVRTNVEHIIEANRDRFPEPYKQMSDYQLQTSLNGAINNAQERVKRNYKAAVPQYHNGKIQLLLPICLSSPDKADLALVVEKFSDFYRASTCLTLDMAYNNARQLARPDKDWLQP